MKNSENKKTRKYFDIHTHVLSGIDDGAENFETSMEMLRIAAAHGTEGMILTPHNKPTGRWAGGEKIAKLSELLKKEAEKEKLPVSLYCGNELYYRSGLTEEIMQGKVCTLADSDYVLIEFNPMDDYDYIRNGIYSLLTGGYHPILAHVERYSKVCTGTARVEDLIKMGAYIQVNAGSIMGNFGLSAKLFTRKLLSRQLVHFVASDAHDTEKRSPKLSECAALIGKKYGEDYQRELLYENPMHVIRNEYI